MTYRSAKEARAVAWAKRGYGRQFRKRMLQRLTRTQNPFVEKWRYRPFAVHEFNILIAWAAHWFRRNYIMAGRET